MHATRSRVAVIFLTILIDLIGFGIVIPIVPYYAKRFGASGFEFGALLGVYSLMQFFAAAVLGRLSDRVGRRPVLLTTMVLNTGGYLLFAFAGSYWALFASRVIGGVAGGKNFAAPALISVSPPPAGRGRAKGPIRAAVGLWFSIGPATRRLLLGAVRLARDRRVRGGQHLRGAGLHRRLHLRGGSVAGNGPARGGVRPGVRDRSRHRRRRRAVPRLRRARPRGGRAVAPQF